MILWDVSTGEAVSKIELPGHQNVECVVFSPDGSMVASGSLAEESVEFGSSGRRMTSDYGYVSLWDAANGELLKVLEGHTEKVTSLAFSPDGSLLASGSSDDTVILWNVETGEQLRTFEGHQGNVYDIAFSPDGAMLASGSSDGTVLFWQIEAGSP